ncbi:unnamed protein product [Euphydryas editha]|uniref:Mos1 transposase HTH domain-containing protein n=1 Tax=Euphydryas editha TaxID=104508 RepID=A0AAU9U308_EUPED|nr:unnamed protein product [Euphydryas editha]
MECDKYEIRALLRHYWKQKLKPAVVARKICKIGGKDTVNKPTAHRWFNCFNSGDLTLEDRSRSGRPPAWHIEVTREPVKNQPSKIYRSCRIVPHELTEIQAKRREEVCKILLTLPKGDHFIRCIVTCNEKWIYLNNTHMENQWLDKGQLPEPIAKRDNAKPLTTKVTRNKIEELGGIELLPYPAFSPDLAPSDYYLFRSMAKFLRGKKFESKGDVKNAVDKCLHLSPNNDFKIVKELAERWVKTIEYDGQYFEY